MTVFSCLRRLLSLSYVCPDFFEVKDFIAVQRGGEALKITPPDRNKHPSNLADTYLKFACGPVAPEDEGGMIDKFKKFVSDPKNQNVKKQEVLKIRWKKVVDGHKDKKNCHLRDKEPWEEVLRKLLDFKAEKGCGNLNDALQSFALTDAFAEYEKSSKRFEAYLLMRQGELSERLKEEDLMFWRGMHSLILD